VTLLAVLATLYTLYYARVVLVPVTIAVLLQLLLQPLVHGMTRWRIPASLSAAVLLSSLLALVIAGGVFMLDPAKEFLRAAPTNLRQLTDDIEQVKAPLKEIQEIEQEVSEIAELDSETAKPQQVEIHNPKLFDKFMQRLPGFVGGLLFTFLTAFFLIASGDRVAKKILTFGRTWPAKRAIIKVSRGIQDELSGYLRTVTLINVTLGFAVGVCLWLLDVPNPELWGTMVAVLNFAPYVGAITSTVVMAIVGIVTFDSLADALVVPGVFMLLTSLEGMLLTPLILGQRMSLNPLVVFLSVFFWGWLWGVPGALIAVPLMSSLKVVLSHIDRTRPIAALLAN
jgi:predicted PurR-regulated permease PerM